MSKIEQIFFSKHGNTFEQLDCTMSILEIFHSKMTAYKNKGIFIFVIISLMESLKLNEKKQALYWTDTPKTHTRICTALK